MFLYSYASFVLHDVQRHFKGIDIGAYRLDWDTHQIKTENREDFFC